METKTIIYLKSWARIDAINTAEQIRDLRNGWAPNEFVSITALFFLQTGEQKVCKMDIIRGEINWVVDFEHWELIMPPQPEIELEPRQKMTREEMVKIYFDRTWKKPHHLKSNKQVWELLNSLPEDIDADNL